MADEIINTCKALVVPKELNATIVAIDATTEMGALFFDTDNSKLMFVKNAGGSETITSA
jgi:hypothetical protein